MQCERERVSETASDFKSTELLEGTELDSFEMRTKKTLEARKKNKWDLYNSFTIAVNSGDEMKVQEVLVKKLVEFPWMQPVDKYGERAVSHICNVARRGNYPMLLITLERMRDLRGAGYVGEGFIDIDDQESPSEQTALIEAVKRACKGARDGNEEEIELGCLMAELLIQYYANPLLKDDSEKTARAYAEEAARAYAEEAAEKGFKALNGLATELENQERYRQEDIDRDLQGARKLIS